MKNFFENFFSLLLLVAVMLGIPFLFAFTLDALIELHPIFGCLPSALYLCLYAYPFVTDFLHIKNKFFRWIISFLIAATITAIVFFTIVYSSDIRSFFEDLTPTTKNCIALIAGLFLVFTATVGYAVYRLKKIKSELEQTKEDCDHLRQALSDSLRKSEQQNKKSASFTDRDPYIQKLQDELAAARDEIAQLEAKLQKSKQEYDEALLEAENRLTALTNSIADIRNNNFFKNYLHDTMILRDLNSLDIVHRSKRIQAALTGRCQIISFFPKLQDPQKKQMQDPLEQQKQVNTISPFIACKIKGDEDVIYDTTFDSCTCNDFTMNNKGKSPCKHMYFLAIEFGQLFAISEKLDRKELTEKLEEFTSRYEQLKRKEKKIRELIKKATDILNSSQPIQITAKERKVFEQLDHLTKS